MHLAGQKPPVVETVWDTGTYNHRGDYRVGGQPSYVLLHYQIERQLVVFKGSPGASMKDFHGILLSVWREACQHIEVHESLGGIARLLAEHIPLDCMIVQRIVPDHGMIATIAAAPHHPPGGVNQSRDFVPAEMKKLLGWVRKGGVTDPTGSSPNAAAIRMLGLPPGNQDIRVTPLSSRAEAIGALTIVAPPGKKFAAKHEEMLALLQEPLAVALENDRRVHELAALREAAEADRRSLLRRLGRTDITDEIIGENGGLAQVMQRVNLVSPSDAPVLLLGETGSGKEVIARAIHNRSDRASGPFIRVNCGAIPPELIDSQLFGHEKGSFTGASETRKGWFERADGGTLFLDEIGELPLEAQVRFLRVLQDSFVERVGAHESIHVDVRVVAATHCDLSTMVRESRFREDLWYRIAVFPILLPPLRDRLNDIPELATHFAARAALRFGLPPVKPTEEDVRQLSAYSWPGNIRELGAVIDRAAILGEGRGLEIVSALGFGISHVGEEANVRSLGNTAGPSVGELPSLNDAIAHHITSALAITRGRVEGKRGAAAILKMNPHTLRAKMRKLGIDWAQYRDE
jgi:hydrogenase-4 transcriptional activator